MLLPGLPPSVLALTVTTRSKEAHRTLNRETPAHALVKSGGLVSVSTEISRMENLAEFDTLSAQNDSAVEFMHSAVAAGPSPTIVRGPRCRKTGRKRSETRKKLPGIRENFR